MSKVKHHWIFILCISGIGACSKLKFAFQDAGTQTTSIVNRHTTPNPPSGDTPPAENYGLLIPAEQYVPLQDRSLMTSTFATIFGSSALPILSDVVPVTHSTVFGKPCDLYQDPSSLKGGCRIGKRPWEVDTHASVSPKSTTDREARRLQACRWTLKENKALYHAAFVTRQLAEPDASYESLGADVLLQKTNELNVPNTNDLKQMHGLFYIGIPPSEVVVEALAQLSRDAYTTSNSVAETWRTVLLALCEAPDWQAL